MNSFFTLKIKSGFRLNAHYLFFPPSGLTSAGTILNVIVDIHHTETKNQLTMSTLDGRKRVKVSNVRPQIEEGRFSFRRAIGESVVFSADIIAGGSECDLPLRLRLVMAGCTHVARGQ